jgi:hypothetical protein
MGYDMARLRMVCDSMLWTFNQGTNGGWRIHTGDAQASYTVLGNTSKCKRLLVDGPADDVLLMVKVISECQVEG